MNVLDKIILHKRQEVEERKELVPINILEQSIHFKSSPKSLRKYLLSDNSSGIIAEYKRKSPSKGVINKDVDVAIVASGYQKAGAAALSILTDSKFFGGVDGDIICVRKQIDLPVLRKEFMIDEYQIIEAKSIGADVILLLANVLSKSQIKQFTDIAHSLGLEVLLEIREKDELDSIYMNVDCVGVNNRNLKDFRVNTDQSFELVESIPDSMIKISESGIDSAQIIQELRRVGYKGFLIGETFMKEENPGNACARLINSIKMLK